MPDKYRPKLHFTPKRGWMNDPNGMVVVDGTYHLFFQHDPHSIMHGPMHWGHAVSRDLVSWEERPLALYPDALGTCYSGSAVQLPCGEVNLFYTAHRVTEEGKDFETQCLVHGGTGLETFRHHPANPVIDNPGCEVFRDPKVIWHAQSGRWIMLLTLGQAVGIYSSADQVDWTFESRFGDTEGRHGVGVWECPDLFAMTAPDASTVWVLVVSIATDAYGEGSGTQYFLGGFDGRVFRNGNPAQTVLWLDHGRDFYAPQSFFERAGGTPTLMAWAGNWDYARQTPTTSFRGLMTLPRRLALVETRSGLRLAQRVPEAVRAAFEACDPHGATWRRAFALDLPGDAAVEIGLFGEAGPHFRFSRQTPDRVRIETLRAEHPGMPGFGHAYGIDLDWPQEHPLPLELYADSGVVELLVADGIVSVTNLFYPSDPEGLLSLRDEREAGRPFTGAIHRPEARNRTAMGGTIG